MSSWYECRHSESVGLLRTLVFENPASALPGRCELIKIS
jgi:hypothetical protein